MSFPKISIITPSLNQGEFITDTILSVINQNYPNLEYIIIDGESNDNTIEIIKKYEKNINFWISEKDKGQANAINKGFKKATGEIVAWLNSDDMYIVNNEDLKLNTLFIIAETFKNNPDIDLIYGDVENIYNNKKELYKVNEFNPIDFLKHISIHQPSVFWRRKIMQETGLLDENLNYVMDYDLWMRIFFQYKTLKINHVLSQFRIHPKSKTKNNPMKMYLEYRKVISRFFYSLNINKYLDILKNLKIYDNPENISYNIKMPLTIDIINKILLNYIQNCIIQEYTFGNILNTNKLLFNNISKLNIYNNLDILIKNNLGIGLIKKLIKKDKS